MNWMRVQTTIVLFSLIMVWGSCEEIFNMFANSLGLNKPDPMVTMLLTLTAQVPTSTLVPSIDAKPLTAQEAPAVHPTKTNTVLPTTTHTVMPTSTKTAAPVSKEEPTCLVLLSPAQDSSFGSEGKITFSWESNSNAASYVVIITAPGGTVMTFPSKTTSYSRWIESFAWGGGFTWQVASLDENGNQICLSQPSRFTKKVTEPSRTAVPHGSAPKPQGTP